MSATTTPTVTVASTATVTSAPTATVTPTPTTTVTPTPTTTPRRDYRYATGYSSSQGGDGWSYLQFDGSNYIPMTWDAGSAQWKGSCASCLVGRQLLHPGTSDAVIGWTAPRAGTVTVRGTIENRLGNKKDPNPHGVRAVIRKASASGVSQVWPSSGYQELPADTMVSHVAKTVVAAGDRLYFHVNQGTDNQYDTTYWSPDITYDFEPPFLLDRTELVMDDADFAFVGNKEAMDASMSVDQTSSGIDFYHSEPDTIEKFRGTLAQPAQDPIYDGDVYTNPHNLGGEWWLTNLYRTSGGALLGFCHIEHEPSAVGPWAIGLAYSTDGGQTFKKLGLILGQHTKDPVYSTNIFGTPYVIRDGYFYAYYGEPFAAVARAPVADVLAAAANGTVSPWRKYHAGGFAQDGLNGQASAIIPPTAANDFAVHGDAAYSTYLNKYLLTGYTHAAGRGIWLTASDDGVNFDQPTWVQSSNIDGGESLSPYETIVAEAGSDNAEVGQSFWIFFNFRRFTKDFPHPDRTMYRQHVTLNASGWDTDVFDASAEFARTQGLGGWSYDTYSAGSYTPMAWDGNHDRWHGSDPYALVGPNYQHPDGRDSVRTWTAPRDGSVVVSAAEGRLSVDTGPQADGVDVQIRFGQSKVWPTSAQSLHVAPGASATVEPITLLVHRGDELHFHVARSGNNQYDTTHWVPVINYTL